MVGGGFPFDVQLHPHLAAMERPLQGGFGWPDGREMGGIAASAKVVFTIVESLNQLQIDTTIIQLFFKAVFAALALGVGLAIGLGCKDMAGRYVGQLLESFRARK
jgi:hypothetical protein